MEPFLTHNFANPSSVYRAAQEARSALDSARDSIAQCLGAGSSEIIFTSGGTESNNTAIKGCALALRDRRRHLVTTAIEHHAVLHPMQELAERFGFDVTVVPVGLQGIVVPADLEAAIRPDTALISVMWANNEIGTIQPVEEIGSIARTHTIPFHVDAVQATGALPIDLRSTAIDLLSISAHKFHGPKGVGALYVRRGTPLWPLMTGGGQERNRRAGTENVAGIAGMAAALRLAVGERDAYRVHVLALRDYLLSEIPHRISGTRINGDSGQRMPNNANFSFEGVYGESVLVGLDRKGVMASSGSACTSGSLEPSHVLQAIGLPNRLAQSSLRLTVGRDNTVEEMVRTVDTLTELVARLRDLAPAAQSAS